MSLQASLNVVLILCGLVLVILVWRPAFTYIVKRQRIDMASERKRVQQDVFRGYRINKRLVQRLWKLSKYTTPQPPGKNKH